MAIVFAQKNKKQKMLVFILVASLIVTGIVLWFGFFAQQKTVTELYMEENPEASQEEININFNVLQNPLLQELQSFSEIQPLDSTSSGSGESKGRGNPFLPY
jgi:cell division protein YceG involved in septum cleavage